MLPQLIVLFIYAISIGISLEEAISKGKPETFFIGTFAVGGMLGLLYWGGFFNCFFTS